MALIKVQSEGINLADDFTFSGTVAGAGGGKLLQIQHDFDTTYINLNTTSWVDTALSIAFTPTSATSQILIQGMVQLYVDGQPSYYGDIQHRIQKDGVTIGETYDTYTGYGGTEAVFNGMIPFYWVENSVNTTSRTYKIQVRNTDTNSGAAYNQYSGYSALIIKEIA